MILKGVLLCMETESRRKRPSLGLSLLSFLVAASFISFGVLKLGVDAHIPIIAAAVFTGLMGKFVVGISWERMETGMINAISVALQAIIILMTIGMVIGLWIQAGVVPGLIYYGLNLLSPSIFLLATLLVCSIVSLATGSSWGTTGTVGIALMGIAAGLQIPAPLAAGIIISGAYFGDKMSPFSDTTNLAPAVSGAELFDHIRAMLWTTGPTYLIVAGIAIFMGMKYAGGSLEAARIVGIQQVMSAEFSISPLCVIPPLLVLGLAALKIPAIPGLFAGLGAGAVLAFAQGIGPAEVINAMHYGYEASLSAQIAGIEDMAALSQVMADSGISGVAVGLVSEVGALLSDLLSRGGLDGMMWSISLVLCALVLGGIMETCGFLEVLLEGILSRVTKVGGLITSVIAATFVSNLFLGDQYLSLVIPGRMFKSAFEERGLAPRMLSRSLEDSGTLTSALIPWNTCGAYQTTVLGVPTLAYAPYAILNWLNPIVAISLTYMGIGIYRREDGKDVLASKVKA